MRKILGIMVALLGVAGCSEIQPEKSQPKLEAIEWSVGVVPVVWTVFSLS